MFAALFAIVLLIEVVSFLVVGQIAPAVRFVLLLALIVLVLKGSLLARYVLLFLLFAGGIFLVVSGLAASRPLTFIVTFHYAPAAILIATGLILLLSKRMQALIRKPRAKSEI
jgi:pheromone shutdown protein TraB